jgi:hypothetical protein
MCDGLGEQQTAQPIVLELQVVSAVLEPKSQVLILAGRGSPTLVGWPPLFLSTVPPRSGPVDCSVSLHPYPHLSEVPGEGMGRLEGWQEYCQVKSWFCWL